MCDELKSRVEKYLDNAKALFEDLDVETPENIDLEKIVPEFYQMATSYYKDAVHFHEKGEYINAIAALEYAEGWLDAGRFLEIFKDDR